MANPFRLAVGLTGDAHDLASRPLREVRSVCRYRANSAGGWRLGLVEQRRFDWPCRRSRITLVLPFDSAAVCDGIRIFVPGCGYAWGVKVKVKVRVKSKVKSVGQECPTHTSVAEAAI